MNERLTGYSARIERLSFHPIGASLTLDDLYLTQNAHPDPAVLHVARLEASVQWKALMFGRVVANFRVDHPTIYADRKHLDREAADPTPIEEHGWQEAFEAIYPLKINHVRITDGEITYVDAGRFKPLRLTKVDIVAENIRNIHAKDRVYPSELHVRALVFDRGRLAIDGNADFLAVPHVAVKTRVALGDVELDYFGPLTNRLDVVVKGGTLDAHGRVEYGPTMKLVDLEQAEVKNVYVDYVHRPKNAGVAPKAAATTERAVREATQRADMILRVEDFRVTGANVGIVNRAATPEFRLFLSETELRMRNVSNRLNEGIGRVELRGKFMGSGVTHVAANLRPEQSGPDFDADIKIENSGMTAMNDVLRAYGKFDVVAGQFSFYSELRVKNGRLDGYVKPLFKDVKAFDPEQDRDKGFGRRLYERVISGVSRLLKNRPRREVATKIDISGPLEGPSGSTLQAIGRLLDNAFFKAILPGFDRQVVPERPPASDPASPRSRTP